MINTHVDEQYGWMNMLFDDDLDIEASSDDGSDHQLQSMGRDNKLFNKNLKLKEKIEILKINNRDLTEKVSMSSKTFNEFKQTAKHAAKMKDKQMERLKKEYRQKAKNFEIEMQESDDVIQHLTARVKVFQDRCTKCPNCKDDKALQNQITAQINTQKERDNTHKATASMKKEMEGLQNQVKALKKELLLLNKQSSSPRTPSEGCNASVPEADTDTNECPAVCADMKDGDTAARNISSDIKDRDSAIRDMNQMLKERKLHFQKAQSLLKKETSEHLKTKQALKKIMEWKAKASVKIRAAANSIQILKKRDAVWAKKCKNLLILNKNTKGGGKAKDEAKALRTALVKVGQSASVRKGKLQAARRKCQVLRSSVEDLKASIRQFSSTVESCSPSIAKAIETKQKEMAGSRTEMMKNYKKEVKLRRKYFNELQELKGNIRVYCRVRPLIYRDKGSPVCVTFPNDKEEMALTINPSDSNASSYEFEQVFRLQATQDHVFKQVSGLVTSVTDGYNVCIFAYGQTGSGKTYTMQGTDESPGIYYRAIQHLFDVCQDRPNDQYVVKLSLLEIYNDKIQDLISGSNEKDGKKLIPREGKSGIEVPGLTIRDIKGLSDVKKAMASGIKNRSVGATKMNKDSSRSHLILSIYCEGYNHLTKATSYGKLHLIDLAGSERLSRSGATGLSKVEAQEINKSLSALGNCIAARANKKEHVPYRDSTLTR
ncbi:hypothetical protein AAMO2058_000632500 [Amorphochlora amoebiformis]